MSVIKVTAKNFEEEVLKSEKPVLADFNADWCGPCRMLKPVIDEISEERDSIKVVSINIDEESELAESYGVISIPCVVLFRNGEEADRSIGFKPKEELEEMLEE